MIDRRLLQVIEESTLKHNYQSVYWHVAQGNHVATFKMTHEEGCRCPCHNVDIAIHIDPHNKCSGNDETTITASNDYQQKSDTIALFDAEDMNVNELRLLIDNMRKGVLSD